MKFSFRFELKAQVISIYIHVTHDVCVCVCLYSYLSVSHLELLNEVCLSHKRYVLDHAYIDFFFLFFIFVIVHVLKVYTPLINFILSFNV